MATLDKWHLLSTYKVRICPIGNSFLHLFFAKEPIHGSTSSSPITITPKITLCIYNSLNQCGVKPFLTKYDFGSTLGATNGMWLPSMALRMYGIPCKLSKPTLISLILSLFNLGITNGFNCFLISKIKFFHYNWSCIFFNVIDLSTHLERIFTT